MINNLTAIINSSSRPVSENGENKNTAKFVPVYSTIPYAEIKMDKVTMNIIYEIIW